MNRFLSLVVLGGLILVAGVTLDGSTSTARAAAAAPSPESTYTKGMDAIRGMAKALNESKESKEKLANAVSKLLQVMDGSASFGLRSQVGFTDENEAWDYWNAMLAVHNKATPDLLYKSFHESQAYFESKPSSNGTAHGKVLYALLTAMSLYEQDQKSLNDYFTHENAEEKLNNFLATAMTTVILEDQPNKNACTKYMKDILWHMFVKRYMGDRSPEQLRKRTILNLSSNRLTILPESLSKLTGLEQLGLDNNRLTTLPECVGKLTSLQQLVLSSNRLTTLPESVGKLTSLQQLGLNKNQLTSMPEWIGDLTALQLLVLSSNRLTTLPESMGKLTTLQGLYLHTNRLTTLPESMGKLTALQFLNLHTNRLTTLPESMGKLTALQQLGLNNNQLTSMPEWIGDLTALQFLNFAHSQLTTLPEWIGKLTALQDLYLYDNQLTTLPESISKLTALQQLNLAFNQLTTLPESISKLTALRDLILHTNHVTTLPVALRSLAQDRTLTLLHLYNNPLVARGNGQTTLGIQELRQAFGDRVVVTEGYVVPLIRVTREEVLKRLDQQPLRINRQILKALNPPPIPETTLNPQEFIDAFEKMINTLNFSDPKAPGYLECTLLDDFTEEQMRGKSNHHLVVTQILPRLRGHLKTLVGLPVDKGKGEEDGWKMYDEQKFALKNVLAFIFKNVTEATDKGVASMLFMQLTNGLLHCPTGQKEGVDAVILALTSKEESIKEVKSFEERVKSRIATLKNDLWRTAVTPGNNNQNVHVLSFYANKTQDDLNLYTSLVKYDEKIFKHGVPNDPFQGSVGNVLQKYFEAVTPDSLAKDLISRIENWDDYDRLANQLHLIQEKIRKARSAPTTTDSKALEVLLKELADLNEKVKQVAEFLRPHKVSDILMYVLEKNILLTGEDGAVIGWEAYFDKDPEDYTMGKAKKDTFPSLTLNGAKRILLHMKILEGVVPGGVTKAAASASAEKNEKSEKDGKTAAPTRPSLR